MKVVLVVALFLMVVVNAYADTHRVGNHLNSQEIMRVKALKEMLHDVDQKSLAQTIHDLEKTGYPQLNLQIREAMAKAFADIVDEQKVVGQHKKEWLYSMVTLNMAYLQFVGAHQQDTKTEAINKVIRYKLKEYLPADIYTQPGFRFSPD